MKRVLPFVVVVIAIAVIVAIALGNKNDNTNPTTPPASTNSSNNNSQNNNQTSNTPQAANQVSIANMSFSPASITVKKGSTVTWTNNDSIAHTVTADSGNTFDSGTLDPGKTFTHTFNDTGSFAYHCNIHPEMHGTVTVTE